MSICKNNATQIRKIETKMATYIFNNYIKNTNTNSTNSTNSITKKQFMDRIFIHSKGLITQTELLQNEIDNIKKANEEYNLYPEKYIQNKKTIYGYPEEYRCNFIIYNKNKFTRCCNKINDNTHNEIYCSLHWDIENKYYDIYTQLIDNLDKNE